MPKRSGLKGQFMRLIFLSGVESVLLLMLAQILLSHSLRFYFSRTAVQQHATQKQVQELQTYVTESKLASTDVKQLTDWTRKQRYILLELYRDQKLIYSSFAPKGEVGSADIEEEGNASEKTPVYNWTPSYTLTFSDGSVQALVYYNGFNTYYSNGCEILLTLCILWWFPHLFLFNSKRLVGYIVLLSEEIQMMEGGDLNHPITIRGRDELTTLASCLDSMRVTLRQQQREEAEASAKVKSLITEMSHDLRTPLTTLLLYTEIVRGGRYQDEEQLKDYLNKIDAKARQLKQLSDNLFEYALVTRDTVVELDPPAHFSQIFEEPLADLVDTLQQRGFACALDLGTEDLMLTVKGSYIRRILDNISSNIVKYADPGQDIMVSFVREETSAGLAFANGVQPGAHPENSTRVGLTSIETMMKKMNARTRVEQSTEQFCITLLFPLA